VGTWGGSGYWNQDWYQNSRPGYNLVLHLNFSGKHNQPYHRLMQPEDDWHPFLGYGHPRADDELTLAWARLDVDLDDGVALIEEIQNDWIRKARSLEKRLASWLEHKTDYVRRFLLPRYLPGGSAEAFRRYLDDILRPHEQLWDEAMLSATLWFLRNELGIRRIFYHTFASGNRLKGIDYTMPPRSLYTRLPRRFCFQETDEAPGFLMNQRRFRREVRKGNIRFYIHEL